MKRNIPYFYFPTTIMLVDDNARFIDTLSYKLPNDILVLRETDPLAALDKLSQGQLSLQLSKIISDSYWNEDEDDNTKKLMKIDFSNIIQAVYNENRFSSISTVIADYLMPNLTGIELFKKLVSDKIRKVLLTGEADSSIAISAFNNKIIDKFILKDAETLSAKIFSVIREAQLGYFNSLSNIINSKLFLWEGDAKVEKHFRKFIIDNEICEYYLWDALGTYFCLDTNANPHWYVVKSEKEFLEAYSLAQDGNAAGAVIKSLKDKSRLIFFSSEQEEYVEISAWEDYIYPCEYVNGERGGYYVAKIHNEPLSIDLNRIQSFNSYQESVSS